jgi:hypothetical protein
MLSSYVLSSVCRQQGSGGRRSSCQKALWRSVFWCAGVFGENDEIGVLKTTPLPFFVATEFRLLKIKLKVQFS